MKQTPPWQYDELKQVGIDYDDPAAVAAYDARHGKFRDVAAECDGILNALAVNPESVVIELGTGPVGTRLSSLKRLGRNIFVITRSVSDAAIPGNSAAGEGDEA